MHEWISETTSVTAYCLSNPNAGKMACTQDQRKRILLSSTPIVSFVSSRNFGYCLLPIIFSSVLIMIHFRKWWIVFCLRYVPSECLEFGLAFFHFTQKVLQQWTIQQKLDTWWYCTKSKLQAALSWIGRDQSVNQNAPQTEVICRHLPCHNVE